MRAASLLQRTCRAQTRSRNAAGSVAAARSTALRRTSTNAVKKEKPPSFHSEKGSVVESVKTTATRHAEALPALTDVIGLAGFGLITVQWLMDDVLVLRCFGLASCTSMIVFNLCRKPPVMLPVWFNVLFLAINGVFIARIVDERRDVPLCGDAAALFECALSDSGLPRKTVQSDGRRGRRRTFGAGRSSREGRSTSTPSSSCCIGGDGER